MIQYNIERCIPIQVLWGVAPFWEYLCVIALVYLLGSFIWGLFNVDARGLRPPAIFPKQDPPPGKEPLRPEEDAIPDSAASVPPI